MLVTPEQLARHPQWRVFDCRHDLLRPELGREQYAGAHIPGALHAHLERDLSGSRTGANGRHPLPDPRHFTAWLGRQGLKPADRAVCYDAGNGSMAARLWWMLRWVGHEDAVLLDGGLARWIAEGLPVTAEAPAFAATAYPCRLRADLAIDAAGVAATLGAKGALLVDARAPARYRGEQEPIDPVAGRIPGAINRFCVENVDAQGRFKTPAALRSEYRALIGDDWRDIVHYCGSGVAACHNIFAMELAGLPGARLYAGSWSEWIADSARPRERG